MSNVFVFRRPPHGVITEYFGGGKGGSTTTTNNVTQIPPEVLARYNAVNARAESVASQPYQSYSQDPNAFVAPLSQTQQAGIQNTNAMAGAAQPYYGAATGLAAQSTGSVSPSALNVGQYMNPYTQSVVNATQAALGQQQAQQLSQQQTEAIRGGAFGGERAGLQRAALLGQQGLAQAQAIAPLYQQNYNQALAAAQQQQGVGLGADQANRQNLQNAATLFGSIGTNAQQAGLAGAQAQLAAGQTQQQTQQAGLQALYNQFQQQQGFPYQQAQFLANIAEGTGALSGNATSGTSTTTGGGGFFSDERLKENIQRVGETDDGQPIYRYNYKGDKNTQIGLLAQDVEKKHPEAVGLAGGYKTVNYKKATEDAVHKDGGGEVSDAYSIGAPSAMLRENSGKGLGAAPSLPQAFQGGRDIPIEAGARSPLAAGLRSPQVTGVNPESRVGAQTELESLRNAPSSTTPGGAVLGSGPGYISSRINTLEDWLNKNASPGPQYSSAGGLVGPEGGAFAHGGSFARGGLADGGYMNPALAYYSPQQAQQGVIQLQPNQQRQILQGQQMQTPQQRQQPDAVTSAMNMAKLVEMGNKARPDFLRSAADVEARQRTADALVAREQRDIDWAKEKGYPLPSDAKAADKTGGDAYGSPEEGDDFARGGLIGDRHHYSLGGGNPYGLGGGNDLLGDTIKEQDVSRRIQGDKATPPPQPKQQQSGGLGQLAQMASLGKSGKDAYGWAAKQLTGEASPTAMSATSTEAVPGLAGAAEAPAATEAAGIAGAAPETLSAGLAGAGETAAGLAGAGEAATGLAGAGEAAAGLAGGAEALGAGAAAAGAAAEVPWWLMFLKDGGAVPRRHFDGTDGSFVNPEDVGGGDTTATGGDDQTTTISRTAPITRAPRPEVEAPRVREPVEAPKAGVASSYLPDFSKIVPEGAKDTLSSENFWVPAIAGLGAMLASPNKTLAGAIGSGLVGGTTAYTNLEKQNADILKQRFELAKDVFEGPIKDKNGQWVYRDNRNGEMIPMNEYAARRSAFMAGKEAPARSAASPAVETAREVISEAAPSVSRPSAATTTAQEQPAPQVQETAKAPPALAPAPTETAQPKDLAQIKAELEADAKRWATAPPARNPILLKQQAATLEAKADIARRDAEEVARMAPKSPEAARLTTLANQLDANRKELTDRAEGIINDAAGLAYKQQEALAAGRTAQEVGRGQVPSAPDVTLPEGKTVAQAENDPDYLGSRIESNMKKYNELKGRGALEEANKYLAAADKDRDRLEKVIGTEHTTPYGTKYSVHPNADVFNVTQPKPIPKDYKATVDPNTGIVMSKPVSEFVGYPETGGHPVDPALIGKKVVIKGEGDKRLMASKAQSDALEKDFVGGAEKAQDGIDTIIKFSTAAKVLESKGTNMQRAELANLARGLGFNTIADQFMSGQDTAAAFTALKTNVDQAINQVTNNFARPTQAEFLITEKKATPSLDMPVDASHSLAQTRLAGLMWQNAILSDWETAKRETGTTNFAAFRDIWQKTHPKALFEEAADRALGNFKGQNLPKPEKFTEGVVYVVPKNAGDTQVGRALVAKGLRPGDLFVMNGVNHEAKDIGEPSRVSPADAYKAHLRAPALTYGAR